MAAWVEHFDAIASAAPPLDPGSAPDASLLARSKFASRTQTTARRERRSSLHLPFLCQDCHKMLSSFEMKALRLVSQSRRSQSLNDPVPRWAANLELPLDFQQSSEADFLLLVEESLRSAMPPMRVETSE